MDNKITEQDKQYMREAIRLANESVERGGGPFGAVIVKDGEVIAGSSNSVTIDNDPTAHAEVNTIRQACRKLGTFDLSGATIYTSCEPCPMCLGAIYWARISRIFYGNNRKDARDIDFADDFIYEELDRPLDERTVPIIPLLHDEALISFRMWMAKEDKKEYWRINDMDQNPLIQINDSSELQLSTAVKKFWFVRTIAMIQAREKFWRIQDKALLSDFDKFIEGVK